MYNDYDDYDEPPEIDTQSFLDWIEELVCTNENLREGSRGYRKKLEQGRRSWQSLNAVAEECSTDPHRAMAFTASIARLTAGEPPANRDTLSVANTLNIALKTIAQTNERLEIKLTNEETYQKEIKELEWLVNNIKSMVLQGGVMRKYDRWDDATVDNSQAGMTEQYAAILAVIETYANSE